MDGNNNNDPDYIKLETDQLMCSHPRDYGVEYLGNSRLYYKVQNPFVREQECPLCETFPCGCPHDFNMTAPFVYECKLCKRKGMDESAANHHLDEPTHIDRMSKVYEQREEFKEVVSGWIAIHDEPSMKRLRRDDADELPDKVLAEVFRYVTNLECTRGYGNRNLEKATAYMLKHENMGRMALLHLAVWKAECLGQMPTVDTFLAAQQWMVQGWKSVKAEQHKSHAMGTVVSLVLPFL